ncbi:hypothetical protein IAR55_001357 [Kwoniella newhampshirensis]|uniref:Phytanoyl-CoA dioxygenase n=1 Tax=Kwoniella newhampshirensis TaxID=1651941 RepID=A0AAW0Z1X1_9TREE
MSPITPTAEELSAGKLSPESLYAAINSFHRDGFLVLERVEDPKVISGIKEVLLTEGEEIQKASHEAERLKPTGNFLQGPPSHLPELQSHRLHKNPFVLQVLNAYLGARPQFVYTCGNNATKRGTERQKVHTGESETSAWFSSEEDR